MGGQKRIWLMLKVSFGNNIKRLMWALTYHWGKIGKTLVERRVGIAKTGEMGTLRTVHATRWRGVY